MFHRTLRRNRTKPACIFGWRYGAGVRAAASIARHKASIPASGNFSGDNIQDGERFPYRHIAVLKIGSLAAGESARNFSRLPG